MSDFLLHIEEFHFLRPFWLLGLIPAIGGLPSFGKVLVGIAAFMVPLTLALKHLSGYED